MHPRAANFRGRSRPPGRQRLTASSHIYNLSMPKESPMGKHRLVPDEELIGPLRNGISIALKLADRLGLHMVGIHLNNALECLSEGQKDKDND
ncbi:hypothetical protein Saro_2754 [Novosphingobium aromaticivorans DSM 12444]|uniref:Uncharacterized protein n=2 Tax=Novosphingobium aromaticivorans TaxID=48935 RepID=Q2G4N3_NOVAD|nr:hypothetical protein Saro_2754 [Novosphingobium aromaticivorans DSM 12444]